MWYISVVYKKRKHRRLASVKLRPAWPLANHLSLDGQVTDVARNHQTLCLVGTAYVAATALLLLEPPWSEGNTLHEGCPRAFEEGEGFMGWFCAARMTGSSGSTLRITASKSWYSLRRSL